MPTNSALHQAYLATCYRVTPDTASAPFDLRIGQHHAALDQHLRAHGFEQAAFVTACNPYSVALSAAHNRQHMAALHAALRAEGWSFWPGLGIPDHPGWSAEPSVLILGMDKPTACVWGRRYAQNAIVHVRRGQAPELIWLEAPAQP